MVDAVGNHLHYACHPHEVVIFSALDSGQIPRLLALSTLLLVRCVALVSALGVVFEPVAGAEITADPELGVGDFD